MRNLTKLPQDLPVPVDDGACHRLLGQSLRSIALFSTEGSLVDLSAISGRVVIYSYPMTSQPSISLPDGWDEILGARGCTPQTCAFRDRHQELSNLDTQVFGLSKQSPENQIEATKRLHLPFELLSDGNLSFAKTLNLPIFEIEGMQLVKRVTLVAEAEKIIKVFYPVFPPDRNADEVINWLQANTEK